jgi:CPA1 family monovalent cation:H+ antiporter
VLCSGYAEVLVGGRRVATVPEGSGFGEFALLTGEPRTATVRALVPCDMLSIDRVDFLDLLSAHPLLVKSFATMIAQRILGHRDQGRPESA